MSIFSNRSTPTPAAKRKKGTSALLQQLLNSGLGRRHVQSRRMLPQTPLGAERQFLHQLLGIKKQLRHEDDTIKLLSLFEASC